MDQPKVILPSSDEESQRLELQARLYGGISVLSPFLAQKPPTILDVGCGSGDFTLLVAAQAPESMVTGLELDRGRIALARQRASSVNINYVRGDLHSMPFDDGRFDLAFCRFVLVHDQDPGAALGEMARVTRPGGRVVAYDMVHEGIWLSPHKPAFAKVVGTIVEALRRRGAEPNQGLYLAAAMRRAGLEHIEARVIPHHALASEALYDVYRQSWKATLASLADLLGSSFTPGLIEAAQGELDERTGEEFLVEITVLAWGVKG